MPQLYPLLLLVLLPFLSLGAQSDSLLRELDWHADDDELVLRLTPDGTFEFDYGAEAQRGRYLMGRYRLDTTGRVLTLSVDYFLGKRRIPNRYRRGNDFYLEYDLLHSDPRRLVLRDRLTDELRHFTGRLPEGQDPALRPLPTTSDGGFKLPDKRGGGRL
jgi:hypothetical protein